MMKKYLFISNSTKPTFDEEVSRERIKLSNVSLLPIEVAESYGYQIYMGINRVNPEELECENKKDINFYNSSTYRSLLDIKSNITAFSNLLKLLKKEDVQVIHCNTPIGGLVGRLCGKFANVPKVIYTAHGFHFYKGAPLINRTLFQWVEMWLAHYTDAIITINKEDFQTAQDFKLHNSGKVYYIPGVGVDTSLIKNADSKRQELLQNIRANKKSFLVVSVGELNSNKNNKVIIEALGKLKNPNFHYLICGVGDKKENLVTLAKELYIEKNVHFLGYRTDVPQIIKSCDVFVMPSFREGLSRSIMEAMSAGLPCVVSKIRGNTDLIDEIKGGYVCQPNDAESFADAINNLAHDKNLRARMGSNNLERIKQFDVVNVKAEMREIYEWELRKSE